MNGAIIVDKPKGKTSFDMIRDIRKEYNIKKVGHIGTLDPMATGVLPILVGEATKLSDYLMNHDKEYIATLCLGEKRDTGDSEGKVIETKEIPQDINKDIIVRYLNEFLGESMQIPPMYSAIKIGGQKLYDLARQGKQVEREPRKINIYDIELLECLNHNQEIQKSEVIKINDNEIDNIKFNEIKFRVVCSKGTYIRVLCEDIAKKLGTVGYMKALRRTRVGRFKIEDAGKIIDIADILIDVPKIEISDIKGADQMKKLTNGVAIKVNEKDGLVNLYNDGKFIGIGQVERGILKRKIII